MDILQLTEMVLSTEGATLPLLLVAAALCLIGMALYVVILLIRRQKQ